jgi:SAM-dependent methyltransferase
MAVRFVSPIYWHPTTYRLIMRVLERGKSDERYRAVAEEIGELGVLDLCCGDCWFLRFLPHRRYRGMDINRRFVRAARRNGIDAWAGDPLSQDFPSAECITILHSLYQFYPDHEALLRKMIDKATRKVVVCEATQGVSLSTSRTVRLMARMLLSSGARPVHGGLGLGELKRLARKYQADHAITGDNYFIAVFPGRGRVPQLCG